MQRILFVIPRTSVYKSLLKPGFTVCAISTQEIKQLAGSFGSFFLLAPMKLAGCHAYGSWGKSPVPSLTVTTLKCGAFDAWQVSKTEFELRNGDGDNASHPDSLYPHLTIPCFWTQDYKIM